MLQPLNGIASGSRPRVSKRQSAVRLMVWALGCAWVKLSLKFQVKSFGVRLRTISWWSMYGWTFIPSWFGRTVCFIEDKVHHQVSAASVGFGSSALPHVSVYACMRVCMYVCLYVRTYVRTYVCIYVCMFVCLYVRTYVCMYVCMCVYARTYARTYVCIEVILSMYVCTYVCMYVCLYVM